MILDGLHTKFHLTLRTSTTAMVITSQVSLNTANYIHQESTDMTQNNNIVGYALMPAGGVQQAPPAGQTYHLPLEFVTGRTGPRKTRAPGPFPRPAPLNGLGRGVFFGIPCPCPR